MELINVKYLKDAVRFTKPGCPTVYIQLSWLAHKGNFLRKWQIGDKPHHTGVKYHERFLCEYMQYVPCEASNGLLGPFEVNIIYDSLLKPLGISRDLYKTREDIELEANAKGITNGREMDWSKEVDYGNWYVFKNQMELKGYTLVE